MHQGKLSGQMHGSGVEAHPVHPLITRPPTLSAQLTQGVTHRFLQSPMWLAAAVVSELKEKEKETDIDLHTLLDPLSVSDASVVNDTRPC